MNAPVTTAVFDTNILISGHFWKGPPYRCLVAVEAGLVLLVLSDSIVLELREKLTEKFGVPAEEVDEIVTRLRSHAKYVAAQGRSGWVARDPDDDRFVDAALAAQAAFIVSGDRHLLDLGSVEGIRIVGARQFLELLPALSAESDRARH